MPIQVTCGGCKRNLKVPDSLVGKAVKCPKCAHKIKVTAPGTPVNRLPATAAATGKTSLKKAGAKPAAGKTSVETNGKAAAPAAKKPPAKPAPAAKAPTKPPPPAKETPPVKAPTKPTPAAKNVPPPVKNDAPSAAVTKAPVAPPRPVPTPHKPAPVPAKKPTAKGKGDDEDESFFSKFRWIILGGAAVIVLCLAWYFFSGPSAGRVSGTLTWGDEPLVDATVTFVGEDEKLGVYFALTREQGRFELIPPTKAGIPLGKYKVTVQKYLLKDGTRPSNLEKAKEEGLANNVLPQRYETKAETPLFAEVGSGNNSFSLKVEKN